MTFPFYDYDSDFFSTEDLLFLAGASGKAVEDTATGNPLVFTTDLAKPLKSLLVPFTPQQSGTGDPSPTNIRPLLPWDGLTVWQAGKNLFDYDADNMEVGTTTQGQTRVIYHTGIMCDGRKMSISSQRKNEDEGALSNVNLGYFKDGAATVTDSFILEATKQSTRSFTYSSGYEFVLVYTNDSTWSMNRTLGRFDIQLEYGDPSDIVPATITETDISFPSPVYGGTLDVVSGVMTVDFVAVDMSTMGFSYRSAWGCWVAGAIENCEVVASNSVATKALTAEAKAVVASGYTSSHAENTFAQNNSGSWFFDNGSDTDAPEGYLIVPLATPQTIQLTPEQITAIKGSNTMWSDADGSMTAVFLKKG